jgi:hypothetical protein
VSWVYIDTNLDYFLASAIFAAQSSRILRLDHPWRAFLRVHAHIGPDAIVVHHGEARHVFILAVFVRVNLPDAVQKRQGDHGGELVHRCAQHVG